MPIHILIMAMSVVVTLAALIGYLNVRFLKIPTTIAISAGSLLLSLLLLILGEFGFRNIELQAIHFLSVINFHDLLIDGMLSFMLFAGALNIKSYYLKQCKWEITMLALVGTIVSAFFVGFCIHYLLRLIDINIPLLYAFLFGALISPTDPIAVLSIFKELNAPKRLDVTVAGESLFNDGVGIVLFLTISELIFSGKETTIQSVSLLFLQQAVGGVIYGFILGWVGYWFLKPINDQKVAILITLAIASGGYAFSELIGVSGPLAMVIAGIVIGNHKHLFARAPEIRKEVEQFWELMDEVLNAILFLLIGLELLALHPSWNIILIASLAIPTVLIIRFVIVGITASVFRIKRKYDHHFVKILTWGGLRGGLAIALALAIPDNAYRNFILAMTYCVVIFSIVVQGLSIKPLVLASKKMAEK